MGKASTSTTRTSSKRVLPVRRSKKNVKPQLMTAKCRQQAKVSKAPSLATSFNSAAAGSIDDFLGSIQCVGGVLPRRTFQNSKWHFYHLPGIFSKLFNNKIPPNHKLFCYLQTESLNPNDLSVKRDGSHLVPVLIAVSCPVEPTRLMVQCSLQAQTEDFKDMLEYPMSWEPASSLWGNDGRVFGLKCKAQLTHNVTEFMQLYLKRPCEFAMERPTAIESVNIPWKGKDIVWVPTEQEDPEECVDEFIEDENLPSEEKAPILNLLIDKRRTEESNALLDHEVKAAKFYQMIVDIANSTGTSSIDEVVKHHLDSMKVFKIYPSNKELKRIITWAGPSGFIKNNMVNRFIGNASEYFPSSDGNEFPASGN
jgi:hypothetical protein